MSRFSCMVAVFLVATSTSFAQVGSYPNRPIRLVVPSTPGGGLDVLARITSPRLMTRWGQRIVIDNRSGAGGIIGTDIVAKAAPDGYTLLIVTTGFASNPFLHDKLPYSTPADFAPITILGSAANVLVAHPGVSIKTVKDLIASAKDKRGQLTFASPGVGSGGHLAMALFQRMAGLDLVHVPYKGGGAATAAVITGESQFLFTGAGAAIPHLKSGRMQAIGITSAKRVSALPDVPTVAESGLPGYEVDGWYGVMAPAGTPKALIDKIYGDVLAVLKMREVASQIQANGFEQGGMPPAEFSHAIKAEMNKWQTVIKEAGIRAE